MERGVKKSGSILFTAAGDPLAALILCGVQRADRVLVADQWRVIDGQASGLDVADLMYRQQNASWALLRRAGIA